MSDQVVQAENAMLRMLSRWALLAIAGALGWAVVLLINIDKRDSVQTERLDNIAAQIDRRTADRYTSKDASIDKAKQANVDAIQHAALEKIMERLNELIAESHNHKWPEYYEQN